MNEDGSKLAVSAPVVRRVWLSCMLTEFEDVPSELDLDVVFPSHPSAGECRWIGREEW